MTKIKKITEFFILILLTFSLLIFSILLYVKFVWPDIYYEQIIYSVKDTDLRTLKNVATPSDYAFSLLTFFILFPIIYIKCNFKQQFFALLLIIFASIHISGFDSYVIDENTTSHLYEDEYINPKDINIEFPEQKRNLVFIFLESFEQNFTNEQSYGKNLIYNLEKLLEPGNHSNNYHAVSGTKFSIHSLIAEHCGIPYKYNKKQNIWENQYFLPQVTCFSDILNQHGYQTKIIKAADINFTNAGTFARNHGYQEALGVFELQKEYPELTEKKYNGSFGGLSDRTLFKYAKKELAKFDINKPFLLTLFSLDTHAPSEFHDPQCPKYFNDIRDAFMCTDKLVYDFIEWLKKSPYWENTTVIIIGDHLLPISKETFKHPKKRGIYNVFLNLPEHLKIDETKDFATFDLTPTILESLDIKLTPRAFGLGRSLFASDDTLIKKIGHSLNNQINQNSQVYKKFHTPKETRITIYTPYTIGSTLHEQDMAKYSDAWEEHVGSIYLDCLNLLLDKTPSTDLTLHLTFKAITDPKSPIYIKANNQELLAFNPPVKRTSPLFTFDLNIKKEWIKDNKLQLTIKNTKGTANAMQMGISPVELTISPKP